MVLLLMVVVVVVLLLVLLSSIYFVMTSFFSELASHDEFCAKVTAMCIDPRPEIDGRTKRDWLMAHSLQRRKEKIQLHPPSPTTPCKPNINQKAIKNDVYHLTVVPIRRSHNDGADTYY
jgi:hypothetical protein